MSKHVLNIEGIPGVGKSTAAARIDSLLRESNIDSYWVREEDPEHPIGTLWLPRTGSAEKIASAYLECWEAFVNRNSQVAVLDGYAFQSTVRFLFAMNADRSTVHRYFSDWQNIGTPGVSLVFLRVDNPVKHFREFVFPMRGEVWCQKVSSYVSSTPFGRVRSLAGKEGLIEFWSEYQTVCLELLRCPKVSTRIQNYSDRSWISQQLASVQDAIKVQ